jgi:hypothetical protein
MWDDRRSSTDNSERLGVHNCRRHCRVRSPDFKTTQVMKGDFPPEEVDRELRQGTSFAPRATTAPFGAHFLQQGLALLRWTGSSLAVNAVGLVRLFRQGPEARSCRSEKIRTSRRMTSANGIFKRPAARTMRELCACSTGPNSDRAPQPRHSWQQWPLRKSGTSTSPWKCGNSRYDRIFDCHLDPRGR